MSVFSAETSMTNRYDALGSRLPPPRRFGNSGRGAGVRVGTAGYSGESQAEPLGRMALTGERRSMEHGNLRIGFEVGPAGQGRANSPLVKVGIGCDGDCFTLRKDRRNTSELLLPAPPRIAFSASRAGAVRPELDPSSTGGTCARQRCTL